MSIKTLSSRIVYKNRWMTVREDEIQRADGSLGIYSVVEKAPAALIVPIDGDHVFLIEQFRYPVGRRFMEFPGGAWELLGAPDPVELARGELREETGLLAGRMEHLGQLFYAYGITGQTTDVFRATDLVQGPASREAEEQDLVVKRVSMHHLEQLIYRGVIQDAATIAAWALHGMKPRKVLPTPAGTP
ncbi:MAG TPA: NUDIX hydrolase [Acidisarcina sp.]